MKILGRTISSNLHILIINCIILKSFFQSHPIDQKRIQSINRFLHSTSVFYGHVIIIFNSYDFVAHFCVILLSFILGKSFWFLFYEIGSFMIFLLLPHQCYQFL